LFSGGSILRSGFTCKNILLVLSLFGLRPTDRILNRLSFLKICSSVLLSFLLRPQTIRMFCRSKFVT
jgi:hypothetical protein